MTEIDLENVDWGRVYAEALELALKLGAPDADDRVQEGMTLVLSGDEPFEPGAGLTLAAHVAKVGIAHGENRARAERRRRKPGMVAKVEHELYAAPPTPEDLAVERRMGERAFDAVLAGCEDDPEVRALVLLSREDVDEPAAQAARLEWGIERVRNARKRMARVVEAVAEAMQTWKVEGDP